MEYEFPFRHSETQKSRGIVSVLVWDDFEALPLELFGYCRIPDWICLLNCLQSDVKCQSDWKDTPRVL